MVRWLKEDLGFGFLGSIDYCMSLASIISVKHGVPLQNMAKSTSVVLGYVTWIPLL